MEISEKRRLRDELLESLRRDLRLAEQAHGASLEAATHAEAKPENSKDTRALEQSYLARGQAMRVEELQRAVAEVGALSAAELVEGSPVGIGAIVTIREDNSERELFIAPHGGGALLVGGVQALTPTSPLGAVLVGKTAGEVAELVAGKRVRELEILSVR